MNKVFDDSNKRDLTRTVGTLRLQSAKCKRVIKSICPRSTDRKLQFFTIKQQQPGSAAHVGLLWDTIMSPMQPVLSHFITA